MFFGRNFPLPCRVDLTLSLIFVSSPPPHSLYQLRRPCYLFTSLIMATRMDEFEEKKLGTEVDPSTSFDKINALVAEGMRRTLSLKTTQMARDGTNSDNRS